MSLNSRFVAGLISVLAGGAAYAQGACPCGGAGTRLAEPALSTLLAGKTVCAKVGNEAWQEFHSGSTAAGGQLIDYKRGPGHPVDPSEVVGSWSVVGSAGAKTGWRVRYDYGSGGAYEYAVCQAGTALSPISFCGTGSTISRNITGARLQTGQGPC
jgi:hypothetical protein